MRVTVAALGVWLCTAGGAALFGAQIQLSASASVVGYGAPVTFTATVSGAGPVEFLDGAQFLGVGFATGGTAMLTTRALTPGTHAVVARSGGLISSAVSVAVVAASAQGFGGAVSFSGGNTPNWLAIADFNGDGIPDVASLENYGQVQILLGRGDGAFSAPKGFDAGQGAWSIATGDFNGDGVIDLVVGDLGLTASGSAVSILLGRGDGTFGPPVPVSVDLNPTQIVAADFNLDGKLDVAVAGLVPGAGDLTDVTILLGNGDGTLRTPVNYATGTQTGAYSLAVADFNGDGVPDLAVVEDSLVVMAGNGNGSFSILAPVLAGTAPDWVVASDFNGDGRTDLAVVDSAANQVEILLGIGNGLFATGATYTTGQFPYSAVAADFNGDGLLDLATANSADGVHSTVSVMLGRGDGTFAGAVSFAAGSGASIAAVADFNGDAAPDLAIAEFNGGPESVGGVEVLLGSRCSLSVGPDSVSLPATVTITAPGPTCGWQVLGSPAWLSVSPLSGMGSATITLSATGLSTGLLATLAIGSQPVVVTQNAPGQVFNDVPPTAYYYDAVNLLSQHGITAGCGNGNYCPSSAVTRAEMAIFVVRTVYGGTIPPPLSSAPYFSDVTPSSFAFNAIQKLKELGITAGCGAGMFCPDEPVSRDQMAIFIVRARYGASTLFPYSSTPIFDDVPASDFAFEWVQRLAGDSITAGCGSSNYCPASPVLRGDMAIFLMRGGFNQLLPTGTPVIASISPSTITRGTSGTFTITGLNTHFTSAAPAIAPVDGITAANLTVVSDTELTASIEAPLNSAAQPASVWVITGAESAILPNGLLFQ